MELICLESEMDKTLATDVTRVTRPELVSFKSSTVTQLRTVDTAELLGREVNSPYAV